MKNTLLRSVAAGALLVGSSLAIPAAAFAQDTTTKPPAADTSKPADTTTAPAGSTGTDTTKPADTGATDTTKPAGTMGTDTTKPADATGTDTTKPAGTMGTDTTKPADTGTDTTAAPAAKSDGQEIVTEQEETQVLASTYIGQSVYNAEDKSIGDISDLVFNKDGGIQAAIIGVGGFLGIGQKDVAVKFDRIEIQREPDSADVKLVTDMTADQLKQAPAFKNLQTKMNEQNANQPATGGGMTGTGTTGGGMTGGATGTGTAPAQ